MREALLICLTVVLLIIGILVIKNMGVDNSSGVTKTRAEKYTDRAKNAAVKTEARIKDTNALVSGSE